MRPTCLMHNPRPVLACLVAMVAATGPVAAQVVDLDHGRWVDLTHAFDESTLYWPTASGFHKSTVFEGETDGGWYYAAYDITTAEHGGTHLDAPIHFFAGRQTADEVPLERLHGQAAVVDIREACDADPDYRLSAADLAAWESEHGRLGTADIVLVRTGFAAHWPQAERYLGTAQRGVEAVPMLHFPGLGADAARLLVKRGIKAVGIDTASVDPGQSRDFMAHRILFEANIPGFENVADLSPLPARGAIVFALPMKIRDGSGAPLRITAFLPER